MLRNELIDLRCGDISMPTGRMAVHLQPRSAAGHRTPAAARTIPAAASPTTCTPCAAARWLQMVAAFDAGGRSAVIRLIKADTGYDEHICGCPRPRTRAQAPFFRSIRKNGILSPTPLSGAAMHRVIRHRAELAGYAADLTSRLGVHSLRAGFLTQALRGGADRSAIMRYSGLTDPATLEAYADADAHNPAETIIDLGL